MIRPLLVLLSLGVAACAPVGSREFFLEDRVLQTHFHEGQCAHFEGHSSSTNRAQPAGLSRRGFEFSVVGRVPSGYLYAINQGNSFQSSVNSNLNQGFVDEELEDLYRAMLRFREREGASLGGADLAHFEAAADIVGALVGSGRSYHPERGPFVP